MSWPDSTTQLSLTIGMVAPPPFCPTEIRVQPLTAIFDRPHVSLVLTDAIPPHLGGIPIRCAPLAVPPAHQETQKSEDPKKARNNSQDPHLLQATAAEPIN